MQQWRVGASIALMTSMKAGQVAAFGRAQSHLRPLWRAVQMPRLALPSRQVPSSLFRVCAGRSPSMVNQESS